MKRVYRATSSPGFQTITDRVINVDDEIIVSQDGEEYRIISKRIFRNLTKADIVPIIMENYGCFDRGESKWVDTDLLPPTEELTDDPQLLDLLTHMDDALKELEAEEKNNH